MRRIIMSVLGSIVLLVPGANAKPPEGQLNYIVNHSFLGCVSLARNSISYDGDQIIVESSGKLLAKLGPIVVRSEDFERREVYENGQLVEYSSVTVENRGKSDEKQHQVSTENQDGKLIVLTNDGNYQAPATIYTTNPLFIESAGATNLIGSKTGVLHTVEIIEGEIETVELESGAVDAKHYSISGTSLLTDLWYDDNDVLVRFIVNDGGNPVEVILTQRESCDD